MSLDWAFLPRKPPTSSLGVEIIAITTHSKQKLLQSVILLLLYTFKGTFC